MRSGSVARLSARFEQLDDAETAADDAASDTSDVDELLNPDVFEPQSDSEHHSIQAGGNGKDWVMQRVHRARAYSLQLSTDPIQSEFLLATAADDAASNTSDVDELLNPDVFEPQSDSQHHSIQAEGNGNDWVMQRVHRARAYSLHLSTDPIQSDARKAARLEQYRWVMSHMNMDKVVEQEFLRSLTLEDSSLTMHTKPSTEGFSFVGYLKLKGATFYCRRIFSIEAVTDGKSLVVRASSNAVEEWSLPLAIVDTVEVFDAKKFAMRLRFGCNVMFIRVPTSNVYIFAVNGLREAIGSPPILGLREAVVEITGFLEASSDLPGCGDQFQRDIPIAFPPRIEAYAFVAFLKKRVLYLPRRFTIEKDIEGTLRLMVRSVNNDGRHAVDFQWLASDIDAVQVADVCTYSLRVCSGSNAMVIRVPHSCDYLQVLSELRGAAGLPALSLDEKTLFMGPTETSGLSDRVNETVDVLEERRGS